MSKLVAVIRREYVARVRSKWFIFTTLFAPVLLAGALMLPALLLVRQAEKEMAVAILDPNGQVAEELLATPAFRDGRYRYVSPDSLNGPPTREELRRRVIGQEISAYLYVPEDVVTTGRLEFWARDISSPEELNDLRAAATVAVRRVQARALGIPSESIDQLTRSVSLETYRVTEAGAQRERGQTWITAQVLGLAIYTVVLLYGAMMLRAAVAEKSNKMIEIVLSSVRPWQLMLGKTLGVGAVGLTQVTVWLLFLGGVVIFVGNLGALAELGLLDSLPLGPDTLVLFLALFLTGYFLYAGMYASVGAIATTEQEAAQLQFPVTLVAIIPAIVLAPVLGEPDSLTSTLLSWVPFFAPVLFIGRFVLDVTAAWEIPIVFALQLATILLVGWIGGRIYRVGLLMTGKRPTVPELLRWIRHG